MSLELEILDACATRSLNGSPECHGFLIATLVKSSRSAKLLTAYGTLYRALSRLEKAGFLRSRWEDMSELVDENRPRRRLYRITDAGSTALIKSRSTNAESATGTQFLPIPKQGLA